MITQETINDRVATIQRFSDYDLRVVTMIALDDLETAAKEQPNSTWHKTCLEAYTYYANECQIRGVTL